MDVDNGKYIPLWGKYIPYGCKNFTILNSLLNYTLSDRLPILPGVDLLYAGTPLLVVNACCCRCARSRLRCWRDPGFIQELIPGLILFKLFSHVPIEWTYNVPINFTSHVHQYEDRTHHEWATEQKFLLPWMDDDISQSGKSNGLSSLVRMPFH